MATLSNRFVILGTGHVLPERLITSIELDKKLGHPNGFIERVSGIRKRYFATPEDTAAKLGAEAAQRALNIADLSLSDIDCLVACSGTMDQSLPCNAALIHAELGLSESGIPAFDINASCLGFIAAINILSCTLAAGCYKKILVVASDISSCGLNWQDLESSAIFGDGAAAAVIGYPEECSNSRILACSLKTYSEGAHLCEIPAGGSRYHPSRLQQPFEPLTTFRMNGKGVFRLAASNLPQFVDNLLKDAGLEQSDIDWVVPHQASHLAMQHLIKRFNFNHDRIIDIFSEYGNQVAASVPTALDVAVRDGRIQRGDRVLLIGTGAGLSIGGVVLEY